uniref:CSON008820 protein n=1 Tax=Culicoides sonorensis TaxID=179676 RepID=A0A336LZA9_CULSO
MELRIQLFCILSILICFIFNVGFSQKQPKLFTMKALSYTCTDIDHVHVLNVTCRLKPQRNGAGILTTIYTYKNVNHLMVNLRLFARNSAGRYNPYLLDVTYSDCARADFCSNGPKTIRMMCNILTTPNQTNYVNYKCPFNYQNYVDDFDLETQLKDTLPITMAPVGEYKYVTRLYNEKTNKTFLLQTLKFAIKPKGVKGALADMTMLNMG